MDNGIRTRNEERDTEAETLQMGNYDIVSQRIPTNAGVVCWLDPTD